MKRFALIFSLLLTLDLTAFGYTFSSKNIDGITIYYNIVDGNAEVTYKEYWKNDYYGDVVIPSSVIYLGKVYTVASIGTMAFFGDNSNDLKSVTIPATVSKINNDSFSATNGLTAINVDEDNNYFVSDDGILFNKSRTKLIKYPASHPGDTYTVPQTVAEIWNGAFANSSFLKEITLPDALTILENQVMAGCKELTTINFGPRVSKVLGNALYFCDKLTTFNGVNVSEDHRCLIFNGDLVAFAPAGKTSYTIPSYVSKISEAFYQNTVLQEIYIPESVKIIGDSSFDSCCNLCILNIPCSVQEIGRAAFQGCYKLKALSIPASVTKIGGYAFNNCSGLNEIYLHGSKFELGEAAFGGLREYVMYVDQPYPFLITMGKNVFQYTYYLENCTLYVPKGCSALYASSAQWCDFGTIKEFSDTICLVDGEIYTSSIARHGIDLTYTRKFNNTNWQPLYVPFNMSYDEWCDYADVAELNDVHQFDGNNDGDFDDPEDATVVEFRSLYSGEIFPNIPYLIRAKAAGEVNFEGKDKTLLAAPQEPGNVWCTNTHYKYTFTGNYEPVGNLHELGAYAMSKGNFYTIPEGDTRTLSPFRAYLTITPINVGYGMVGSKPSKVRVSVDGEMTDGIEGVLIDTADDGEMYDLFGRKVVTPAPGIYIQGGKKVLVK